jgi:4-aminobutyrate aminotransferase
MSGEDASEGELNLGAGRSAWTRDHLDEATRALLDQDAELFIHQSLSTPCLDVVDRAEGIWLIDCAGRRIMDFHGNSVHQVGHGHPRVVEAVRRQMESLPFSPRRYTNRVAIEAAARLVRAAPGMERVLFAPGGSLAIGMAVKLARAATGRHKTVSMWGAFHGASLDAISIGGEAIFRRDAGPLLPGTEHVPPPDQAARFFGNDGHAHERLADYIDYVLEVQGDVSAVIAEPVRWTTIAPPPTGFWPRVRAACDRHGALLVFDEIPSGLGRCGTLFATELTGCVPDMIVLGKGLGGGLVPMAALLVRPGLNVAADRALGHYTHEKSPLGCAAALAVLDTIEQDHLLDHARLLGAWGLDRLRDIATRAPHVRAVRGLSLSFAVEVDDAAYAERVMYASLARGLSFKVGAGTVLTLCPPLIITQQELGQALDVLEEALRAV